MSTKAMDAILSRWFRDAQFREQLRHDPEQALVGYDLTPEQRARLLKLKKQTGQNRRETSAPPSVDHNYPFSLN